MNRISIRTKYVGAEVSLHGRTGRAHRPANATVDTWEFEADSGARVPCNGHDVTVWVGATGTANAA